MVATLAILASFAVFGKLGTAFMPESDEGAFRVSYRAQPCISIERSEEIARTLVAEVRRDPGVEYTYTTVCGTTGRAVS